MGVRCGLQNTADWFFPLWNCDRESTQRHSDEPRRLRFRPMGSTTRSARFSKIKWLIFIDPTTHITMFPNVRTEYGTVLKMSLFYLSMRPDDVGSKGREALIHSLTTILHPPWTETNPSTKLSRSFVTSFLQTQQELSNTPSQKTRKMHQSSEKSDLESQCETCWQRTE